VSGQLHAPAALPPGKELRYPLDRRLGGPQSRSGRRGEHSWPYRDLNPEPSVVQPVASRYTDNATKINLIYTGPTNFSRLFNFEPLHSIIQKSSEGNNEHRASDIQT
jgi:hypothetical protein